MKEYLKAYVNYDAISSYQVEWEEEQIRKGNIGYDLRDYKGVRGQVEIYDEHDNVEWESYPTEEDMQERADYINNNKLTWKDI